MASGFEYQASQFVFNFVDNTIDDNDGADSYFDVNHEEKENRQPAQAVLQQQKEEQSTRNILKAKRRSSGASQLLNAEDIVGNMKKLAVSKKGKQSLFEGILIDVPQDKQHSMVTRQDTDERTPKLTLRTRSINRSILSDFRKRKGSPIIDGSVSKYVSLAESVLHFEKDTPERFHTKRRSDAFQGSKNLAKRRSTKAITPNLISHFRHRPVTALTQQQKEDLELEEMKKNQVKAMPLNEKILQPPDVPAREVKPPTKASPFNLTQVTKKIPSVQEVPFKFTAKPVPKHILKGPVGLGPKPERLLTVPQSPAVCRRSRPVRVPVLEVQDHKSYVVQMKEVNFDGVVLPQPGKVKTTTIKPFSFEERNKELFKKKEQKIQEIWHGGAEPCDGRCCWMRGGQLDQRVTMICVFMVVQCWESFLDSPVAPWRYILCIIGLRYLLEEKKAREFHANPVPNFKSQHYRSGSVSIQPTKAEPFNFKTDERLEKRHEKETCSSLQSEDEPRLFRARSPKVLQMKPFEPKKPEREPLEVSDFHLHTERRAKDREAFDMRIIEKENLLMELKRQRELMRQREEEEKVARLRKETVHKALPVPKYLPPHIEKSKAHPTIPRSPDLSYKFGRSHSSTTITHQTD